MPSSENALIVILCRYKDLTEENEELSKDINQLEQFLSSHVSTKRDRPKQEQGSVCHLCENDITFARRTFHYDRNKYRFFALFLYRIGS